MKHFEERSEHGNKPIQVVGIKPRGKFAVWFEEHGQHYALGMGIGALVIAGAALLNSMMLNNSAKVELPITFTNTGTTRSWGGFTNRYDNPEVLTSGPLWAAGKWAAVAWSAALGVHLKDPVVIKGDNLCGSIQNGGCARVGTDIIQVVGDVPAGSEQQLMLHEYAHLLGVPHIYDDVLMNPEYTYDAKNPVAVKYPTEQAIALAKVHHIWDRLDFPLRAR